MHFVILFGLVLGLVACSKEKPPLPSETPERSISGTVYLRSSHNLVAGFGIKALSVPNDPLFKDQWNLQALDLPAAWEIENGCSHPVKVAILDSGIFPHEDLPNVLPGYDFISDPVSSADGDGRDPDPTDSANFNFGTHLAGVLAAGTDNGIGMAGINWCASVVPIRVLDKNNSASDQDVFDAIHWAIGDKVNGVPDNPDPVKVINISLSGPGVCPTVFQEVINAAVAKNVTVVVSAGNRGSPLNESEPASCQGVIPIGSTDDGNDIVFDSNYGPEILLAPGGNVFGGKIVTGTTKDNKYLGWSGTAVATIHATSVVSLILSQNPDLTPTQIKQRLINSTQVIVACPKDRCGYGLINAVRALDSSRTAPMPPANLLIILENANTQTIVKQTVLIPTVRQVPFKFDSLDEGTYLISACLDKDFNEKCDETDVKSDQILQYILKGAPSRQKTDLNIVHF